MKEGDHSRLLLSVYAAEPLFDEVQLKGLECAVRETLPAWAERITVARGEDAPPAAILKNGVGLENAIREKFINRNGIGSCTLRGAYDGILMFPSSCKSAYPPELNKLAAEFQPELLESSSFDDIAAQFFRRFVLRVPSRYGRVCLKEEFAAKNIEGDEGHVRAIGVTLDLALPGVYWLNYLGDPYVSLIGKDRLLSTPDCVIEEAGGGVILQVACSPLEWISDEYKDRVDRIVHHIGADLFFDRKIQSRQTRAPEFFSKRLPRVGKDKTIGKST
jgi:hypothetical protein